MGTREKAIRHDEKAIRHGDQKGNKAWGPERRLYGMGTREEAIRHGDQRGNKAWGPERRQ